MYVATEYSFSPLPSFSFLINYGWGESLQYHLILLETGSVMLQRQEYVSSACLPRKGCIALKPLSKTPESAGDRVGCPKEAFFSPSQVEVGT